jgi:hypothetical protein
VSRFEIREEGVRQVEQDMVRPHMRNVAEQKRAVAARLAPRGPETDPPHEHLADSIVVEEEPDELTWHIGSRNDHALFVELGTSPHEIRPTNPDGVLAWTAGGVTHFAKVVHHPGTQAQPYLRPALYGDDAP